jgi:hypothetical protein
MVTSALFLRFPSQGSIWQLLDEIYVSEEDSAASVETGFSTESESRQAEVSVGEGVNVGNGVEDALRLNGLRPGLWDVH